MVANTSEAAIISLQSHPAWAAAQRRERQRMEAIRRHPSFCARQLADNVMPLGRKFRVYSGSDTPA